MKTTQLKNFCPIEIKSLVEISARNIGEAFIIGIICLIKLDSLFSILCCYCIEFCFLQKAGGISKPSKQICFARFITTFIIKYLCLFISNPFISNILQRAPPSFLTTRSFFCTVYTYKTYIMM